MDVIVGGPPCQAYSLVGRAQSSHMEVPMAEDPRNYLYKLYARFLKRYQPRMFVFENVIYALQHIRHIMNRNQLCIAPP